METEERIEFLWNVHSYLNEYVRHADTKAELVIAWTSALLGLLVAGGFHQKFEFTLPGSLCGIGFVLLAAAFGAAFWVVRPRLKTSQMPGFIYWKSIVAHGRRESFAQSIAAQPAEGLAEHIAQHLFDLSQIADAKYRWVGISIALAFLGSVLCGVMYMAT